MAVALAMGLIAAGVAAAAEADRRADDRYARGRYLAEAVVDCQGCHTRRSPPDFSIPVGPEWAGGEEFGAEWRLPGTFVTPNLTPDRETGLGDWSAEEIKNAIRNGVRRDGQRLFPLMPSHFYRAITESDFDDLVFYLQSLPPRRKPDVGETRLRIVRAEIPVLYAVPVPEPESGPPVVARGRYLVTIANCLTCHSPTHAGQLIAERYLAGGVRITAPWGVLSTPNITPAVKTGIAPYTEKDFMRLMRDGVKRNGEPIFMNYMPWYVYKHMNDADLKAIYAYLRSVPPIENEVYRSENQFPLGN